MRQERDKIEPYKMLHVREGRKEGTVFVKASKSRNNP